MKTGALFVLLALQLPAALLDRLQWSTAAANYEFVNNLATVTSSLGQSVTVSQQGAAFFRLNQNDGWYGNFTPGEELLWTYYGGPITLDFGPAGASAIRFQIQADLYEAFTAQLELTDAAGSSVATTSGAGLSTPMGDGSALWLSFTGTPFQRATIQLLSGSDLSSFAINAVQFNPAQLNTVQANLVQLDPVLAITAANSQTLTAPVPEPATVALSAASLLALFLLRPRNPR